MILVNGPCLWDIIEHMSGDDRSKYLRKRRILDESITAADLIYDAAAKSDDADFAQKQIEKGLALAVFTNNFKMKGFRVFKIKE